MKTEVYREVAVMTSLAPDTYGDDDTFTGTTVDMYAGGQRFTSAMALVVHGSITTDYDGAVKLQESADGASWSDVDSDDLEGSFLAVAAAQAEKVKAVGYTGHARYLRLVLTAEAAESETAFVAGLILAAPGDRAALSQP